MLKLLQPLTESLMEKRIVADIGKCVACKSCELACALEHSPFKTIEGSLAGEPKPQPRIFIKASGKTIKMVRCRHCKKARCIEVCTAGALYRNSPEGLVLLDPAKCTACQACIKTCPFGAIVLRRDGKAIVKCDLCQERAAAGRQPACVEACPTRALKLSDGKEVPAAQKP